MGGKQDLESLVFSRKIGNDIPETIANLIKTSNYISINELLANAYDADAKKVRITFDYDAEDDSGSTLTLEDDGTGMNKQGLESFYRIGDSEKKSEKPTQMGRRMIGRFGIATLALFNLCSEYTLTTWKDGKQINIDEQFGEQLDAQRKIEATSNQCEKERHGTRIVMKKLKFSPGEDFSLDRLRWNIENGFPLDDSFQVHLNNDSLKWRVPEHSREFDFKKITGKLTGEIYGKIYYSNTNNPSAGVYIFVNGRRLEIDPGIVVPLAEIRPGFEKRIFVKLHADDLSEKILFTRSGFTDDKVLSEIREYVKQSLKPVKKWLDAAPQIVSTERLERNLPSIISNVEAQLSSLPMARRGVKINISGEQGLPEFVPGIYNSSTGTLLLNQDYASLRVIPGTKSIKYESLLLGACIDAIAAEEAKKMSSNHLIAFQKAKAQIWNFLMPRPENQELMNLQPSVFYEVGELKRYSHLSIGAINYLSLSGILKPNEQNRILGKDFMDVEQKTQGLVPLYEAIRMHTVNNTRYMSELANKYNQKLVNAGKQAEPFARNLSSNPNNPCFFIEDAFKEEIIEKLEDSHISRPTHHPGVMLKQLADSYHTISSLASRYDMSEEEVLSVGIFCDRNNLPLSVRQSGGRESYRVGDFVAALHSMKKKSRASV